MTHLYDYDLYIKAIEAKLGFPLFIGRGCAFNCKYCGGSTLSYGEMVSRIAACLENVRPLFLPVWVLKAATGLASFLPAYSGLNAQMVVRQCRDQVFDDSDLRDALGYDPRPFHPGKQDFAVPADASSAAETIEVAMSVLIVFI